MAEKICGIYCIENKINGKKYVGKTIISFTRRWYNHKWHLNRGTHANRHLQQAWNKYGEESFKFYILLKLPVINWIMNVVEPIYIFILRSHQKVGGYNLTFGGEGSSGWIPTQETRDKISKANTGKVKSEEARNKLSKSMRENPPMLGKHHSPETKEKLRIASTGRTHSDETKLKQSNSHKGMFEGEKNPNFGMPRSEEAKRKTSEKVHREKHPRFGKKTSNSSSKYHGVLYDGRWKGTWVTKFTLDGKKVYLGSSKSEIEAAQKYDEYVIENKLLNPLNFPIDKTGKGKI